MVHILIVDDTAFMRQLLRRHLEAHGFEVSLAASGAEAVEVYRAQRPDIVLLDYTMPGGMNGLEALQAIRADDREAKVIICSAISSRQLATEALKQGARDYLPKPFTPHDLTSAVDARLRRAGMRLRASSELEARALGYAVARVV
ncbi:MAG: response regulator, partial [Chloroflexota bacterium]